MAVHGIAFQIPICAMSKITLLVALLLAFPFAVTAQSIKTEKELIAVLDLQHVDAKKSEASALTDRFREELLKSRRFTLVDRSQMEAILDEQALQQTGCTEQECAVQVGRILGVRKIVTGKVTKISDKMWLVSAMMVDVETAETLKAESVRHRGDFFTLMDVSIVDLANKIAGIRAAPRSTGGTQSTQQAAITPQTSSRTWRDPVTGMEFVRVPGGSFEMGCHFYAGKCNRNEKQVRKVRLSGFWMGKYEVTQGQWKRIMGDNPSKFENGDNYPVEKVDWNEVQEFIQKFNSQSSAKFRLPSEAQWEYACRAGGETVMYGTENGRISPASANYQRNYSGTTPVGRYQANGLGLHDMAGNVWEWVQDTYTSNYSNVGGDNPIYGGSGNFRVYRGGSWGSRSRYVRCSYRYDASPSTSRYTLGFRLLRD